jgi:hypothetical protein
MGHVGGGDIDDLTPFRHRSPRRGEAGGTHQNLLPRERRSPRNGRGPPPTAPGLGHPHCEATLHGSPFRSRW